MKLGQTAIFQLDLWTQNEDRSANDNKNSPQNIMEHFIEDENNKLFLKIELEEWEKYSYLLRKITLGKSLVNVTDSQPEVLKGQARQIEEKITYLLENIKLLEIDDCNLKAQLRSYPPTNSEEGVSYYEIILQAGNHVSVMRYQNITPDGDRRVIPFNLTKEVFARLVDDLAQVIQGEQKE